MVPANIHARPNAHGTLWRLKRARKLLRLRLCQIISAQELPRAGHFAEPIFHLRDDESAQLQLRQLVRAEHGVDTRCLPFGA